MTKTEHYQLPQWEQTDRLQREEFNAAMGVIDEGMAGALSAAGAAQETADGVVEALANRFVTGSFRVDESTKLNTDLATFAAGAKLALLWYINATATVLWPGGSNGRLFFGSWDTYRSF